MNRNEQLRAECQTFHDEHPKVWELFARFTFQRINIGFKHYSVNAVFEAIRWEADEVGGDGQSTFKLNNNYRAFYARRFMRMNPEHAGFFRTRRQTSELEDASTLPPLGPGDYETYPMQVAP